MRASTPDAAERVPAADSAPGPISNKQTAFGSVVRAVPPRSDEQTASWRSRGDRGCRAAVQSKAGRTAKASANRPRRGARQPRHAVQRCHLWRHPPFAVRDTRAEEITASSRPSASPASLDQLKQRDRCRRGNGHAQSHAESDRHIAAPAPTCGAAPFLAHAPASGRGQLPTCFRCCPPHQPVRVPVIPCLSPRRHASQPGALRRRWQPAPGGRCDAVLASQRLSPVLAVYRSV